MRSVCLLLLFFTAVFSILVSQNHSALGNEYLGCQNLPQEEIHARFPSDGSSPYESMVRLEGAVKIECASKNSYYFTFSYKLTPLSGAPRTDTTDMRFRFVFSEKSKCIESHFRNQELYTNIFDLQKSGEIFFHVIHYGPHFKWRSEVIKLVVYEKSSEVVAALYFIPVLVPSSCQ